VVHRPKNRWTLGWEPELLGWRRSSRGGNFPGEVGRGTDPALQSPSLQRSSFGPRTVVLERISDQQGLTRGNRPDSDDEPVAVFDREGERATAGLRGGLDHDADLDRRLSVRLAPMITTSRGPALVAERLIERAR
jgi:hypothetical protein